jgi:multiple sugar transport system substrate-binding protein
MNISRRDLLRTAGVVAATSPAWALLGCDAPGNSGGSDSNTLAVLANAVHQTYVTGTAGAKINVLKGVLSNPPSISWHVADYLQMQQLELRQATLGSSNISLYFALQTWAAPRFIGLLEDLDSYQAKQPIDEFTGIETGLLSGYKNAGKLYGIPMSPVADVLFYDKQKLAAAGQQTAPSSFDQVLQIAKATSGKGKNGAPNYGIRFGGTETEITLWARVFGGDTISSDYQIKFTEQPMLDALSALHDLYSAGAIPKDFFNLSADDWLRMEEQGQVAMTIRGTSYYQTLNNPASSRLAGHLGVTPIPPSSSSGQQAVSVPTATWYMVIPKNSPDKDGAWNLIKALSSPKAVLDMALNTNTPIRSATLDEPQYANSLGPDLLAATKVALATATPDIPGFDQQPAAVKILQDQATLAIQGNSSPADAMAAAAEQIRPLLPQN